MDTARLLLVCAGVDTELPDGLAVEEDMLPEEAVVRLTAESPDDDERDTAPLL